MTQCEAKVRTYRPFVMGGPVFTTFVQCENEATIRVFPDPERDGDQPPMVLCGRCYAEFEILNPDYKIELI